MKPAKPLPQITTLDRPFWEHARRHELHLQRCANCARHRYPASPVCAECGSARYEWSPASGRGEIVSWVVFHRCYFPSFEADIPYNVAGVRLDEGVVMMANILAPNDALRHRMPVEVVFEDATSEISIPKFQPVSGTAQ